MHFRVMTEVDTERLLRAEEIPREPILLRVQSGRRVGDIMGATDVTTRVVSDRFLQVLRENQLTGWRTYPVDARRKDGTRVTGVHGLAVTGRSGPMDRSRTRIVEVPPRVPSGQVTWAEVGFYFDLDTWDGSDLFIPEGTVLIALSPRAAEVLRAARLSNADIMPLSEYEVKKYGYDPRLPQ